MTIKPLRENILVKVVEEKSELLSTSPKIKNIGEVIEVGSDVETIEKGDNVYFKADDVHMVEDHLFIVDEYDVLAIKAKK